MTSSFRNKCHLQIRTTGQYSKSLDSTGIYSTGGGHNLGVLHRRALGQDIEGAHDAARDVDALFDF